MKTCQIKVVPRLLTTLFISHLILPFGTAYAQGTAFTYQGRLSDSGLPANGAYDLRFILYNSSVGGSQQGAILTNTATVVSNGLFVVTLDFASQFPGSNRWLEIAARTNGPGPQAFVTLSPRQPLTPTPYAIFANASSNLSGTLSAGQLSGRIANANLPTDPSFSGTVSAGSVNAAFSGDGSGLTNLSASQLSSGVVPVAALGNAWKTTGNSGTAPGVNFLGTTDNQPLLMQASFVGVGRTNRITAAEYFGINVPGGSGAFGGMFINATNANALPFYGYSLTNGYTAYHYLDGSDGNKWELYNSGLHLTVTPSGNVGIDTTTPTETLEINGTSRLDEHDMFLRTGTDRNHGLGYRSSVEGIFFDGPFLYGFNGGGLGVSDPESLVLRWYYTGDVWISNNCSVATLSTRAGASFTGNVGIGTAGPVAPLDVEGNDGSGSFNAPVALIQNANTSLTAAPALRVIGWGNLPYGALSVSANGTGLIAQFGNYSSFVADIQTNGTVDAVAFNPTSDRNAKENFSTVDAREILEKVVTLPISEWNYKIAKEVRHVGPMAQDFYAAFAVGTDDRHIATVDADGVALAAIQGLNQKLEFGEQMSQERMRKLETENAELRQQNQSLEKRLQILEQNLLRHQAN